MQDQSPQVFFSYANVDQGRVLPFFDALEKDGFNVWLDCKKLKPGQNWDFEIKRAFDKSTLVVAFLSEASVGKRGYVQRELKLALDKLSEKLIDDIYIIPVLLDEDLPIPEQLKGIQCISAHAPDCLPRVSEALTYQLGRLGLQTQRVQHQREISWAFQKVREEWDGLPGYEVEMQFVELSSSLYAQLPQASDFIRGDLLKVLFAARASKLAQDPDLYNYGQDKFRRTNTYDVQCGEPSIVGKILTVQCSHHSYFAGAAHGNMGFSSYSFVMEPLCLIEGISSVFKAPEEAFKVIQSNVRRTLKAVRLGPDDQYDLDPDWVDRGTEGWDDFSTFVPRDEGIEFHFAPYAVAAYACGPQVALVPYEEIVEHMRSEYLSAFDVEHVLYRKKEKRSQL